MESGFGDRKADLSEYLSSSSLGDKITGAFADRPENTLAGSVLGMAHDLISNPKSEQQKAERAAKHDMAAFFVADTVAIVPQFKAATAGLTRAALLIDPHSGISGNALNFGKNFAEGAALNGVGRMAGASGQRITQAYLGRGLLAESATHLSVGFGFGAVKSGFDAKSWHNDKGEFSVGSGAASILKGGSIGAAFNMPAGFIGLRAAKGTAALLGENVSTRATNFVAGTVSGYTGGAVFGGIESVMHGKSLSETMENIHMAGTAGALTGGIISSFDHGRNPHGIYKYLAEPASYNRPVPQNQGSRGLFEGGRINSTSFDGRSTGSIASSVELVPGSNRTIGLARDVKFSGESEGSVFNSGTRKRPVLDRPENLKNFEKPKGNEADVTSVKKVETTFQKKSHDEIVELLDYKAKTVRPEDFAGRLRRPRTEILEDRHLKKDYTGKPATWEEFVANSEMVKHRMRVWDVEGHTAVLKIEESYAQRQDFVIKNIGRVQAKADEAVPFDNLSDEVRTVIGEHWKTSPSRVELLAKHMPREDAVRSVGVIEARMELVSGEYAKVILPHEFIAALETLPDRSLVKTLTILGREDPMNPYLRIKFDNPIFTSAASADQAGNITFYLPPEKNLSRSTLNDHMNHEWSHLVDFKSKLEHELFALAAFVDKDLPPEDPSLMDGVNLTLSRGQDSPKISELGKAASGAIAERSGPGTVSKGNATTSNGTARSTDNERQIDGKFYMTEYSQKNRYENWAVHMGDEAMSPSADRLIVLGDEMPVRTAIFMRALGRVMSQSTPQTRGVHNETYANRVNYTQEVIVPKAVDVLVNRIKTGTASEKAASAELLGYLGNKEDHTAILRRLAADKESIVLPDGVPEATNRPYTGLGGKNAPKDGGFNERRTVKDIAFDSALRLRERSPEEQIDFLIEQGRPGSPNQELALERLEMHPSDRGHAYARFLRLAGNPKNTPELIRMMSEMPDKKGSRLVFEEALKLGEGGEGAVGYRKSLVMKALEIPSLRGRALDMVSNYLEPKLIPTLDRLSRQTSDPEVASKAKHLLDSVHVNATIETATMMMTSSVHTNVEAGVQQAAKIHDHRLIEPLLEVYLSGPESARASAAVALREYQPTIVKFFARNMNRDGRAIDGNLINKLYQGFLVSLPGGKS